MEVYNVTHLKDKKKYIISGVNIHLYSISTKSVYEYYMSTAYMVILIKHRLKIRNDYDIEGLIVYEYPLQCNTSTFRSCLYKHYIPITMDFFLNVSAVNVGVNLS